MSLSSNNRFGNYLSEDTIASTITALGGPVCVIRMSGPKTKAILHALLQSPPSLVPRVTSLRWLKAVDGKKLDEALVVFFQAPDSFTGEDVAEISVHGSGVVIEEIFRELLNRGVRQALPGEFSFRAVKNGKMTLSQARAVSDLISSRNRTAKEIALERLSGSEMRLVNELSHELKQITTLSELGIDFSDQDIDEVSLGKLKEKLSTIDQKLKTLEASFERGKRIQEGVCLALAGLPNAGKSSLFNALLGEERALVTEVAGTTRDVLRETLTLNNQKYSITLRVEDTAGLRETNDKIEVLGIERARKSVENADLVLFVVDATESFEKSFEEWEKLGSPSAKTIGIINKIDLASEFQPPLKMKGFNIPVWCNISAHTLSGMDSLVSEIIKFCARSVSRIEGEFILTREDQKISVSSSRMCIHRALNASAPELFSSDVRGALAELRTLIGETTTEEILGRIFSQFCIGK